MTRFFIRLKGWQLEALLVAAFLVPLAIYFFRFIALGGLTGETAGPLLIAFFCQVCGIITVLEVSILFAWQRTTSDYLNSLLPGNEKDSVDYNLYTKSLFLITFIGIAWAILFFTRYIFVLFFYVQKHSWSFVFFFIFIFAMFLLVRKTFIFTYKACTSLLTDTPYSTIKVGFFSSIYFQRQGYLQNMIRQVYLKYGERN